MIYYNKVFSFSFDTNLNNQENRVSSLIGLDDDISMFLLKLNWCQSTRKKSISQAHLASDILLGSTHNK